MEGKKPMILMMLTQVETPDDRAFLTELFQTFARLMFAVAGDYVPDWNEREEIVQDSLVKMVEQVSRLRSMDRAAVPVYLTVIVRHMALNHLRHGNVERKHTVLVELDEAEPAAEAEEAETSEETDEAEPTAEAEETDEAEPAADAEETDEAESTAEAEALEEPEELLEEVDLDEEETTPVPPSTVPEPIYEDLAGWVALNDSGESLQWMELEDGVNIIRSPRMQRHEEDIRVSLDDLCKSAEGWNLTDEEDTLILEAQGHTLALVQEEDEMVSMVDGIEMFTEPGDFDFSEGHFIRVDFLTRAR